jgi:hypothetical protein
MNSDICRAKNAMNVVEVEYVATGGQTNWCYVK